MRHALLVVLLAGAAARGESIAVRGEVGFDLSTQNVTDVARADLRVGALVLEARHGLRLEEGAQQFASTHPIVIGPAFLVRDAQGQEHRFWVRAVAGDVRWVELVSAQVVPGKYHPSKGGSYAVAKVLENGRSRSSDTFAPVTFRPDGTFVMGAAGKGRFSTDTRTVVMQGLEWWGRGELNVDGSQLVFRFRQGASHLEVSFQRSEPDQLAKAQ